MGHGYGGFKKKYEIKIDKDVKVDLDYNTDANWDFDIDVDKDVNKDIDIDVKVDSKVDLDGHYAEVDFIVEDVAEHGDLEWDITNVADAEQGVSVSAFTTYEPCSAGEYTTGSVASQAIGYDTFTELVITYEAYDYGFVASGEAIAASS